MLNQRNNCKKYIKVSVRYREKYMALVNLFAHNAVNQHCQLLVVAVDTLLLKTARYNTKNVFAS